MGINRCNRSNKDPWVSIPVLFDYPCNASPKIHHKLITLIPQLLELYMPNWSVEELRVISPQYPDVDWKGRYEVFRWNP